MKIDLKMKSVKLLVAFMLIALVVQTGATFADVEAAPDGLAVITNDLIMETGLISASEGRVLFYDTQDKYGYTDYEGNVVIEPVYEYATGFSSGMARVTLDSEDAFIDLDGKVRFYVKDVLANYDLNEFSPTINDFSGGYAKVDTYANTTYIDKDGKFIVPMDRYYDGHDFKDGAVQVFDNDYNTFIIDASGDVLFEADSNYEYYDYSEGYALTYGYDENQYGYVNKSGEVVIGMTLDSADNFKHGLAVYEELGLYGVLDASGKFLVYPSFEEAEITDDGYVIGFDGIFTIVLNEKMELVGKFPGNQMYSIYGNVVIQPDSEGYVFKDLSGRELGTFDDYYFIGDHFFDSGDGRLIDTSNVQIGEETREVFKKKFDYDFKFLDAKGNVAIDLSEYDNVHPFSEGLAVVEKNGKFGYIDTNGEIAIPIRYIDADDFIGGTASVETVTDYLTIDKNGATVENSYYGSYDEEEELGDYYVISTGYYGDAGVASRNSGKVVLEPTYYSVTDLYNGIFEIMNDSYEYGFYNANTDTLVEPAYSYIEQFYETGDFYVESESYLSGVVDVNGNVILESKYDSISAQGSNLYIVQIDGKYGLVQRDGQVLIKPVFEELYPMEISEDIIGFTTVEGYDYHAMLYDNAEQEIITDTIEGALSDYGDGYILVTSGENTVSVIGFDGEKLFETDDYFAEADGKYILLEKYDGTNYLTDFEGKTYMTDNDFEYLYLPTDQDHLIFLRDGKYGIVSVDGEVKTQRGYMSVGYINSGVMAYFDDEQFGYVDINGEEIIHSGQYAYLYSFSDGLGLVIEINE